MVFFTCNHCGESLKKAAVDKHYQFKSCRNAPKFLTCVDCLKDFKEDYVEHTKCMTEAERYSAKGYVAKPEKNKNAQKQEIWTECIQELSERPHFDRQTQNVLQRIATQSNVPRKKPKFINFLKSSMRYSLTQAEKIWAIIEQGLEEFQKKTAPLAKPSTTASAESTTENDNEQTVGDNNDNVKEGESTSNGVSSNPNIPTLDSVIEHALESSDLAKSTKKTLKKLQKRTDIPLNVQQPKQKKLIKFLKEEFKLDAEGSSDVCVRLIQSIDELKSGSNNIVSSVSLKRKHSDDDSIFGGKKPKTEVTLADSTTDANGESTFDWQKHILRIFNKNNSNNQFPVDSLKTKVIKKFLKSVGEDDSNSAQYDKKFKKNLKKIHSLSITNGIVQLNA